MLLVPHGQRLLHTVLEAAARHQLQRHALRLRRLGVQPQHLLQHLAALLRVGHQQLLALLHVREVDRAQRLHRGQRQRQTARSCQEMGNRVRLDTLDSYTSLDSYAAVHCTLSRQQASKDTAHQVAADLQAAQQPLRLLLQLLQRGPLLLAQIPHGALRSCVEPGGSAHQLVRGAPGSQSLQVLIQVQLAAMAVEVVLLVMAVACCY